MSLEIKSIPVLTGETARRFVQEADKRGAEGKPVRFSKEYADSIEKMLEDSKKFLAEHGGKIEFS